METKAEKKKTTLKTRWGIDLLAIEIIKKKLYLNEFEVSYLTGLSVFTLRNDRFLGRGIPYLRIKTRRIMYRMVDVVAYMERQRISF